MIESKQLGRFNDLVMLQRENPPNAQYKLKPYKLVFKGNVISTYDTFAELEDAFKMEAFLRYGEILGRKIS